MASGSQTRLSDFGPVTGGWTGAAGRGGGTQSERCPTEDDGESEASDPGALDQTPREGEEGTPARNPRPTVVGMFGLPAHLRSEPGGPGSTPDTQLQRHYPLKSLAMKRNVRGNGTCHSPLTRRVRLEVHDPKASSIGVAGSFNGWRPYATPLVPLGGGRWVKDLMLPAGIYEYRLVVDGKWIPDPRACISVLNESGEANSLLQVE